MEEFILKQLQDVLYFTVVLNCVFENASFMKTTCKSFWWWNNWLPTATCLHRSSEDCPEPTQQLKRRKRKKAACVHTKYIYIIYTHIYIHICIHIIPIYTHIILIYTVLFSFWRRVFLFACELKWKTWVGNKDWNQYSCFIFIAEDPH